MKAPLHLYKYVPVERIDILENGTIRFTQPSALNDPFEFNPLFESLLPEDMIQDALNPSFELIEEAIRDQYLKLPAQQKELISEDSIVQFVKDNPALQKQLMKEVEPKLRHFLDIFTPKAKEIIRDVMNKNIGILSLSETLDNLLLWSHYCNSHTGFVLELDSNHAFFNRRRNENDELYHLRKVQYRERKSKEKTLYDLNGDELLCSKSTDWAYEKEWRILVPLEDAEKSFNQAEDEIYLFTFPGEIITSVILGAEIKTTEAARIIMSARKTSADIRIKKSFLDMNSQKITIEDFNL